MGKTSNIKLFHNLFFTFNVHIDRTSLSHRWTSYYALVVPYHKNTPKNRWVMCGRVYYVVFVERNLYLKPLAILCQRFTNWVILYWLSPRFANIFSRGASHEAILTINCRTCSIHTSTSMWVLIKACSESRWGNRLLYTHFVRPWYQYKLYSTWKGSQGSTCNYIKGIILKQN